MTITVENKIYHYCQATGTGTGPGPGPGTGGTLYFPFFWKPSKGFYVSTRLGANYFLVRNYLRFVLKTKFLLPELNFDNINLDKINLLLIPSLGQPRRPELKVTGF